eukprot:11183522-Prorocentrum_lima.AAC.1
MLVSKKIGSPAAPWQGTISSALEGAKDRRGLRSASQLPVICLLSNSPKAPNFRFKMLSQLRRCSTQLGEA